MPWDTPTDHNKMKALSIEALEVGHFASLSKNAVHNSDMIKGTVLGVDCSSHIVDSRTTFDALEAIQKTSPR